MALVGQGVITIDKHGTILSANLSVAKLFGYSQMELVGSKVNMLMASPYSEQHDSYLQRYQETKEPHVLGKSRNVTGLNKQGESISLRLCVSEAETSHGTVFIGIFEKLPDRRVIFDTDQQGKIYRAKGNILLTFGFEKEELLGRNIKLLCPSNIRTVHDEYMKTYVEDQHKRDHPSVVGKIRNLTAVRKDGSPINVSLLVRNSILRVRGKNGTETKEIPGFRGVFIPVDDVEAMVTLSLRGEILKTSQDFCLLFGYLDHEVCGTNISQLIVGEPADFIPSPHCTSFATKLECIHKDLSIFVADISIHKAKPLNEADGQLKQEVFVCKIVRATARKENTEKDLIPEGEYMGVYRYGKLLGSGYFGKVQMAFHQITDGKVAIKTLRKKQYLSLNMEYPPREVQVLKALDHPNVNRLYDTVELPDRIHLILEFVEGKELCELVEAEKLPEEVCRKYWRQLLLAVSYMHHNDMVHRDLKLENIIIDKDDNVKLIDFGFGNFIMGESHWLRTFCGSPDYAAPELFYGKAYQGFPVDCWSLAVCLYAMLSRKLPFCNSMQVMHADFVFPKCIPTGARDLIAKTLVKDPTRRLTIDDMLQHPWTSEGYSGPPTQPSRLFETTPNSEVLAKMEELGFSSNLTKKSLQNKDFNQFTTTYFLLLKKISPTHSPTECANSFEISKTKSKKQSCAIC